MFFDGSLAFNNFSVGGYYFFIFGVCIGDSVIIVVYVGLGKSINMF